MDVNAHRTDVSAHQLDVNVLSMGAPSGPPSRGRRRRGRRGTDSRRMATRAVPPLSTAARMNPTLASFLALLDLEPIEVNIFRGQSRSLGTKRVFGGQVLAQALVAAGRTVEEERHAHSLHAYFLLPGDVEAPIVYQVERLRDGGSF